MKCISKTCQKVIDFYGYRASNCPHVYCRACYLELVRRTKLEDQIVRCSECSRELVLYGTLDLAVVHLHPEKRHAVAADLGYDELVDRWHHFKTLNAFVSVQQQHPESEELPHWIRPKRTKLNASAEEHPEKAVGDALDGVATVKLWQQRVRQQSTLPGVATRRRLELSVLRAQLKNMNTKVADARKDCANLVAEERSISERITAGRRRVGKLEQAAHSVRTRISGASSNRDGRYNYATRIDSSYRANERVKSGIEALRCAGRGEDRATTKLRASIAARQCEAKRLEATEAALLAEVEALKRDLAITDNNRGVLRIIDVLPALCLSFVMLFLSLIVAPQSLGFSIYHILD
ncbi:hypothetical protein K523DRAFT_349904 [Schizophyllum commune Tattone D]|nr:hypothetical protein K523DRAFT_349904 [Schizophyllum commune Tattone D]